MKLPEDLSGQTVLDIGAWDGFFSFEAERRGASRVLATDSYVWQANGRSSKNGFELARRALGSHVEDLEIDVLELSPARPGVFDVVLEVTRRQLILETLVERVGSRRPMAVFHPNDETWNDSTTWWVPNPAAVKAMLKDVGFRRIEQVSFTPRLRTATASGFQAVTQEVRAKVSTKRRRSRPGMDVLRQGRAVFHAFKD